jgi:hypothetical protein
MAGRVRRTVAAVMLVTLLLALTAATSLAAKPHEFFSFSQSGFSAEASDGECTTAGDIVTCAFTSIFVFSGNHRELGTGTIHGMEVCYSTGTDVFNQVTGEILSSLQENGCSQDVADGTGIERDLSSAVIAPTTITLEEFTCDEVECGPTGETRDVTVAGTFTATTSAFRQSTRNVFDDGICVFRDSSRGTSRNATFSGTVDGQPLVLGEDPESGFGQIMDGTFSFSSMCAIEP